MPRVIPWCRYVPLGLKAWFKSCGVINVVEMDWWGEMEHPDSDVKIAFTPAQVSAIQHCRSGSFSG